MGLIPFGLIHGPEGTGELGGQVFKEFYDACSQTENYSQKAGTKSQQDTKNSIHDFGKENQSNDSGACLNKGFGCRKNLCDSDPKGDKKKHPDRNRDITNGL
jgi:hypothetical protein